MGESGSARTGLKMLILTLALVPMALGCAFAASPVTFRMMTYNIHHGEGIDQKVDLERIAKLIKAERADIVGLQEVDKGTERTGGRDFPAELANLTGMSCVFSNNYSFQGGEYGNALLTRFGIRSVTNTLYKMEKPGEQRGILQTVLEINGQELAVFNTHLDFKRDDTERLSSVTEILNLLDRQSRKPLILCGDFNDTPGSKTYQMLGEVLTDCWTEAGVGDGFTIPSTKPTKRIDYIWISKQPKLAPIKAWVPKSEASDHLAVVAEFTLTP